MTCTVALAHLARFRSPGASAGDAPCAPAVAAAAFGPSDGAHVAAELGLTPGWAPVWGPRSAGDAPCAPAKSAAAAGPSNGTRVAAQVGLTPGLAPVCDGPRSAGVCDGPRSAGDAHAAAELGLTPGRLPVLSKSRAGVSFRDVSIGEGAWGIPAFAGPGGGGAA